MKTGFFYVYLLCTDSDPAHFYTGFTEDLQARLAHHNSGSDPHTAKYRPWHLKTAVAFTRTGARPSSHQCATGLADR